MRRRRQPAQHKGAALLAAMLTVTLVASLAASALWQQWRSIEIEAAERGRMQSSWVLTGALDWARLILSEDAKAGGADHLAEPWALPLQEARQSSFLAQGGSSETNDPQAFLSGQILDLQGRLNFTNLLNSTKLSPLDEAAFARLFELLGLPPEELQQLTRQLLRAAGKSDPAAPLMPQKLQQLVGLGLSAKSLERLRPYVTLLPDRTPLNLNTAPAECIYASTPGIGMAEAQALVAARQRSPLTQLDDARLTLGSKAALTGAAHTVSSRFFEVRGRLRTDDGVLEERSTVQRDGRLVKAISREHSSL